MSKTPEGKVKDQIRKYMRASGWTMIHIPGNTFSFPGSPDYIALRKGTCVFIEVKSAKGKLTEAQEQAKRIIEEQGFMHITARSAGDVHDALVSANILKEHPNEKGEGKV